MGKRAARVVRRVDKHALHLTRIILFQRLQRQQVVAEYQLVIELVVITDPMLGVIRQRRIFQ